MPVAKLSRKFSESFGDDLNGELVDYLNSVETGYRAELRDLFEAQFGRFEARLDQRSAELTAKFEREVGQLSARLTEYNTRSEQRDAELRAEFRQVIAELRGDVRGEFHKEIGSAKAELIKWTFVFWAPVVLALLGLYFKR